MNTFRIRKVEFKKNPQEKPGSYDLHSRNNLYCPNDKNSDITSYFCFDSETWNMQATKQFKEIFNTKVTITYNISIKDDTNKETILMLHLDFDDNCAAQNRTYANLTNCRPQVLALKSINLQKSIEFDTTVKQEEITKIRKAVNVTIKNLQIKQNQKLDLIITNERKERIFVQKGLILTEDFVVRFNFDISTHAQNYSLQFFDQSTKDFINLPDGVSVDMNYYILNDLCLNVQCWNNFEQWNFIVNKTPQGEEPCVTDKYKLNSLYPQCKGMKIIFHLILEGNRGIKTH